MYLYKILENGLEITHSQIIYENNVKIIHVHFERPTNDGFNIARCILPNYKWIKRNGFSDEEISKLEKFLHKNLDLIYEAASENTI